jgi:hypothetical protein
VIGLITSCLETPFLQRATRPIHPTIFSPLSRSFISLYLPFYQQVVPEVSSYITDNIDQGETRHRKFKRLKLGGEQVYDRSSV